MAWLVFRFDCDIGDSANFDGQNTHLHESSAFACPTRVSRILERQLRDLLGYCLCFAYLQVRLDSDCDDSADFVVQNAHLHESSTFACPTSLLGFQKDSCGISLGFANVWHNWNFASIAIVGIRPFSMVKTFSSTNPRHLLAQPAKNPRKTLARFAWNCLCLA